MKQTDVNTGGNVRPFLGAVTESDGSSVVTKHVGRGNSRVAADRFPSVDDILLSDRLFDRLAAVA